MHRIAERIAARRLAAGDMDTQMPVEGEDFGELADRCGEASRALAEAGKILQKAAGLRSKALKAQDMEAVAEADEQLGCAAKKLRASGAAELVQRLQDAVAAATQASQAMADRERNRSHRY